MQEEITQVLIPTYDGSYDSFDLTGMVITETGLGAGPSHLVTQRGVQQHGFTVVDMRLDPRVVQVSVGGDLRDRLNMWTERSRILAAVNIGRLFDDIGTVRPCVYRKVLPGGERKWREDLVTTAGSAQVTSVSGRFAHWGLYVGSLFTILSGADIGSYSVTDVINENNIVLDSNMGATATGIEYTIDTGPIVRDLDVIVERGPALADDRRSWSSSMVDVYRFVTHREPLWYNPLRQRLLVSIIEEDNLIFYESPNWLDRAVFPIWFGGDSIVVQSSLIYVGTWPTRPVIEATGPFSYIELENLTIGAKVGLLYDAASGEQITIDIHAQRAYNSIGTVLTRFITDESDMAALYLYPGSIVQDGINIMNVNMTGGTVGASDVTIYWNARYDGI